MYQLKKKILQILLPSMVEAKNFSDHPRNVVVILYVEYRMCYTLVFSLFF